MSEREREREMCVRVKDSDRESKDERERDATDSELLLPLAPRTGPPPPHTNERNGVILDDMCMRARK